MPDLEPEFTSLPERWNRLKHSFFRARLPGTLPQDHPVALSALTLLAMLFGVQLIRVFLPTVGIYLQFTVEVSTLDLLPYALGPFLLGLVVPFLVVALKYRYALTLSTLGLGIARIVEQIAAEPAVDLWASMAGIVAFLWLLPLLMGLGRKSFVYGVLLGLASDTAVRGLTGTLDLSWIGGIWPLFFVTILFAILLYLLSVALRTEVDPTPRGTTATLPLFGFGPILFLELLILQNQGWVSTVTGWSWGGSLILIMLGNVAAVIGAAYALSHRSAWVPVIIAAVLAAMVLFADARPLLAAPVIFLALAATGPFLALAVGPSVHGEVRSNVTAVSLLLGAGNVIFIVLVFLYYAPLGTPLPVTHNEVRVATGILAGLASLAAYTAPKARALTADYRPVLAALVLLAVPIGVLTGDWLSPLPEAAPEGFPVRVMTFNVRWGYGTAGRQTLPEIADQIKVSGADVVGFQEISRGQLYSGSTDGVIWLSRQLRMPYVAFLPTLDGDPLWGLAVISRYPIRQTHGRILPTFGNLIQRGYLEARMDLGADEELLLINTHLNHHPAGYDVRRDSLTEEHLAQLDIILESWANRPQTIFLGDMNARPEWPEIIRIGEAGFEDAWEAASGPGYTFPATDARYRIDYVFHTHDLAASEAAVIERQSSDHFPVVATIELRE